MADKFMSILTRSTRFDRKRFAKDIGVFQKKREKKSITSIKNRKEKSKVLNFFGGDADGEKEDNHSDSEEESEAEDTGVSIEEVGSEEEPDNGDESANDSDAGEDRGNDDISIFAESEKDKKKNRKKEKKARKKMKSQKEQLKALRKKHKIHVQGSDIPQPITSFDELSSTLKVPSYLIKNITRARNDNGCGYSSPTPIQMQACPIILQGRELLACAPTGSGKTCAFLIPILTALKGPDKQGFRALILSPTRELAEQIYRETTLLATSKKFKVFVLTKANANSNTFGSDSSKRKDILITTPMRLVHLLSTNAIDLSSVRHLVLDEADRLFELGFVEQLDEIMSACTHPALQRSMFSATMPQGVEYLARTVLRDPVRLTIGARNAATDDVKQELLFVGRESGKILALRDLVRKGLNLPVLVFVQSKARATQLFNELVYDGINVDVIHSERTRLQRENIIKQFRNGNIWLLICTDLMARGIDFKGVNCVINYDFPQSTVSYIHRIGRTGRGGRQGTAITFFTEQDTVLLRSIANVMKNSGCDIPDWMLRMKKASKSQVEKLKGHAPARKSITPKFDTIHNDPKVILEEKEKARLKRKEKRKRKRQRMKESSESNDGNGDGNGHDSEGDDDGNNSKRGDSKSKSGKGCNGDRKKALKVVGVNEPAKKKKRTNGKKAITGQNSENGEQEQDKKAKEEKKEKKKEKKKKSKKNKKEDKAAKIVEEKVDVEDFWDDSNYGK